MACQGRHGSEKKITALHTDAHIHSLAEYEHWVDAFGCRIVLFHRLSGFGFEILVYLAQFVAAAAANLDCGEFTLLHKVPHRCRLDTEFGANFGFGKKSVFFRLHEEGQKSVACGVDGVNHKLMEVAEADGKENVWRVGVGERGLEKVI